MGKDKKFACASLRIMSFIYLGYMAFSYSSDLIDSLLHEQQVYYPDFKITDYFWFISTKLIICSLYYFAYCFIKNFINDIPFRVELKVIWWFTCVDLAWEFVEMFDYWLAKTILVEFIISLVAVIAFCNLIFYRIALKYMNKTVLKNGE